MNNIKKNQLIYFSAIIGSLALMLLRVFDKAGIFSMLLAIAGMTAFIYSIRHAFSTKEYLSIAGIMAVTYTVRIYGYTGNAISDILLGILIGLIMFALMGAERFLKNFSDRCWYPLIFPVIYILFMYFTEILKINMPFRMDVYFSCVPVLCQITAVFGIYFLDFLLAWTASVLVFFLEFKLSIKGIYTACTYITILVGVVCFGFWHLEQMKTDENEKSDTVCVACTTGPYYGSFSEASSEEFTLEETIASFTGIVKDASEKNVEILVFSEEAYCVSDKNESYFQEEAEKMAGRNNMHILLAYEVFDTDNSDGGKGINKLCWISDEGEIIYEYTKHCLVPLIETSDYVRGDKNIEAFAINVHGKTLKIATAICYDADFDVFMSHMGKNLDLLLLPTWDWNVIEEEHFSVARLRAISTETTLVRSVYDGWSAVIDSTGDVLVRKNVNDYGYGKILVYDVPVA